jgi:hypothetical protein
MKAGASSKLEDHIKNEKMSYEIVVCADVNVIN